MRNIFETGFYYIYLIFIIFIGLFLIFNPKNKSNWLFGLACLILGLGDAFHLIPRAAGLYSNTLDNPDSYLAMWLGIGKLITSITMTIFYVLLYLFIYKKINKKRNVYLDITVLVLLIARLVLLAFPQNNWVSNNSPLIWAICRNIPFIILGIVVIDLCFIYLRKVKYFKLLYLAIILSFGFYIPVFIWASKYSFVGMLMLPKTVCYMWIGIMGLLNIVKNKGEESHEEN